MRGILCTLAAVLIAGVMVAGCADDPSTRQRPGYSYENVDMGPVRPSQQYRFDERPPASQSDPYSRSQSGRY